MDFRQLEYIVAIAENKSISKAAETLFISQSGLNQQPTGLAPPTIMRSYME